VVEVKVPPAPPSLHETVPVGEVGDTSLSVTTAVKAIEFPAVAEAGFGETFVVVAWGGWLTVRTLVPELVACEKSPE
jgi:hypothetical protein